MELTKLEKYLPPEALGFVEGWLRPHTVLLKISNTRNSKLGDYRALPAGRHQITINHDLPPQLFFMVLTHEIAHLKVHTQHQQKVAPHGYEWKKCFAKLLIESFRVYQEDFQPLLLKFIQNPKASYMATPEIVRYFAGDQKMEHVADLLPGSHFRYQDRRFEMIGKRKKHYLCRDLVSGKKYVFNALAEIKKIINEV